MRLVGIGERKCGLRIREPCLRGKELEKEVSPMGEWLHESPQNSQPEHSAQARYLPQLHSFPSVVMRRLWAAHDPETTVRTRTPDRHPYLWGPHKF